MTIEQARAVLKARTALTARAVAIDYRSGMGVHEIAAEYSISWQSVYRHLVAQGVERRGNLQAARRHAVILDLYKRLRMTGYQISIRTGFSYRNVCFHLKKEGLTP